MRGFLKANPDVFFRMDKELREKMKIGVAAPPPVPVPPADGEVRAQEIVRPGRK